MFSEEKFVAVLARICEVEGDIVDVGLADEIDVGPKKKTPKTIRKEYNVLIVKIISVMLVNDLILWAVFLLSTQEIAPISVAISYKIKYKDFQKLYNEWTRRCEQDNRETRFDALQVFYCENRYHYRVNEYRQILPNKRGCF